jgi:hypothetical protein
MEQAQVVAAQVVFVRGFTAHAGSITPHMAARASANQNASAL